MIQNSRRWPSPPFFTACARPENAPPGRAKKAAEDWARAAKQPPRQPAAEILDNARRNGMDEDSLERMAAHLRREAEKETIWVDSDLWAACSAFAALSGYGLWRYYPTGGLAGFDWQQARNHPLVDWTIDAETWRLVAIMERAAVGVFND